MDKNKILIVGNQTEIIQILKENLVNINRPLHISDCISGEEAMVLPKNDELDLLISETNLPGISGIELVNWYRNINPGLKIILISGESDQNIKSQVAVVGADSHFIKPIDIPEFLDHVERCLGIIPSIFPTEMDLEREQIGKNEIFSDSEQSKELAPSSSELLKMLYEKLSAYAVLLVSAEGKVLVRVGKFPQGIDEGITLSNITATFIDTRKLSSNFGRGMNHCLISLSNDKFGLLAEPVGEAYFLLVVSQPFVSSVVGLVSNETNKVSNLIAKNFERMGISTEERNIFKEGNFLIDNHLFKDDDLKNINFVDESMNNLFSNLDDGLSTDADSYWTENAIEIEPNDGV